jgi:cytosine/adenosine deaminase-related metal-dependent hydrolase
MNLDGLVLLPGLINAHDHLEFNLFPRLGCGPYANATDWALDIYHPEDAPVRDHLQVPKRVRLFWGGIKNLLAGVTTVVHHNPYEPDIFGDDFPVRVVRHFGWAHSRRFSPDIRERYEATPPDAPFIIHACEGTDQAAADEIRELDALGVLGPRTVIVHGVGLDSAGIDLMLERGASLIWCPSSNHFTLGRTISTEVLNSGIPNALGTDSALTGQGDLLDELELATRYVPRARAYEMVTTEPARILRLNLDRSGDLVAVKDQRDLTPELVVIGGRIKLISERLAPQISLDGFHPIEVGDRGRYFIACDLPHLLEPVKEALGDAVLSGKVVTV